MNTENRSKINQLIHQWPKNAIIVDSWLKLHGVSNDLKHAYFRSHWLAPFGHGAAIQDGANVDWRSGLYALQEQLKLPVHMAGKTALEEQGFGHFVRYQETKVWLFAAQKLKLPTWFSAYQWGPKIELVRSDFLPLDLGLTQKNMGEFSVTLSSPERAILEVLYLVPGKQGFEEALLLFEGLTTLRPKLLQELLTNCQSIKVKRLFFFMADQQKHPWFKRLDVSKIDLGHGKRSIVIGGILNKKYGITVPSGLSEQNGF